MRKVRQTEDWENRVYGQVESRQCRRRTVELNWSMIHRELRRKHVTLSILWDEYIADNPDGYRFLERDLVARCAMIAVAAPPGAGRDRHVTE
jgi:transposase